jgi:hypothetical protein
MNRTEGKRGEENKKNKAAGYRSIAADTESRRSIANCFDRDRSI